MKEETVIKYFNIVLKGAEKFDIFSINNILLKKNFNPKTEKEREYFFKLCDRIEKMSTKLKFFEYEGNNGWFTLSDKGRKSQELGRYFEYEKYLKKKELDNNGLNINIENLISGDNNGIQSSGNIDLKNPFKQKTVNKIEKNQVKNLGLK